MRAGEELPEEANFTVFCYTSLLNWNSPRKLFPLHSNFPSDVNVLCIHVKILPVLDRIKEASGQCVLVGRIQGLWAGWVLGTSGGCVFCFLIMVLATRAPFSVGIFYSSPKRKEKIHERISADSGNCLPGAGQTKDNTREAGWVLQHCLLGFWLSAQLLGILPVTLHNSHMFYKYPFVCVNCLILSYTEA